MALGSGTELGHYEITAQLGKGGMGEVYRARDRKLGREVAIKVLPSEFAHDAERLARLEREARMLAALNHPNIAAIHGLEESHGTRFLVLELVEGDTLADRLKRGRIPVEESLKLALQIAEALEAAHDKGVIHRDLKPANIKVTDDGKVKVLDFGLAKAFSPDERDVNLSNSPTLSMQATRQGVILGTAGYMSPEQASGGASDKRADIWSFGVVLFEMLTGRQVFTGNTVSHVLAAVLAKDPEWETLPPNLNPKVRELLERCLEKEAKDRCHDIADVRIDIRKALADPAGVIVRPVADEANIGPQSTRTLAMAALASLVLGGVAIWFLKPSPPPDPRPVVRSVISPVDAPPATASPGRDIAISPDGSQVAYIVGEGPDRQIYLRRLDQLEGATIQGAPAPNDLFFSPDGDEVGFASQGQGFLRISTQGGPTVTLAPNTAAPLGASWGPDDTIVVTNNGQLPRRVAATGSAVLDLAPDNPMLQYLEPEIVPGGNAVLFTAATGADFQIVAVDLETMAQTVLIPSGRGPRFARSGHLLYRVGDTLWAVAFDPGELRLLGDPVPVVQGVHAAEANFAVSDNGSLAYITQVGPVTATGAGAELPPNLELTIFDRDGNRRSLGAPARPYRSPRISPDGSRIAVEILEVVQNTLQTSVWVYDIGGGAAIRRLTQVAEGNNTRPIWTPDGEQITFASDRDGPLSIYSQPADGSGPAERLTTAEVGTTHRPDSWSPDGVLAFEIRQGPGSVAAQLTGNPTSGELWTRNAAGETALFYDLPALHQFGSSFSPDGGWIAYTSAETLPSVADTFRVFVGAYPGNSPRYEIEGDGASWPVWSADGSELFYRLSTGGGRVPTLNSVNVATDPTFRVTPEANLFVEGFSIFTDYRDFDPFPDGSGFLMLTPVDTPAEAIIGGAPDVSTEALPNPEVVLIQNFFEELNRLVPVP